MKKLTKSIIIITLIIYSLVFTLTPFEASLLNQKYNWMITLNMVESTVFIFGIVIGILLYKVCEK